MAGAARRTAVVIAATAAVLALAACSGRNSPDTKGVAAVRMLPQRILRAPRNLVAATQPQPDGLMWTLAGSPAAGLFQLSSTTGRLKTSFSVSGAARGVTESSAGVIGLALGTARTGALELLSGHPDKVTRTVPLPAPARQVVVGSDGRTFYVLTGTSATASVTIVSSGAGRVEGTIPMPADTVSVVPAVPQEDAQRTSLYALESNGLVDQISLPGGTVMAKFSAGGPGRSMAISPDGSTLYILKNAGSVSNVAVLSTATEAVLRVLPAPRNCVQLLVSPGGGQLYDVVGTAADGNIQVFAI